MKISVTVQRSDTWVKARRIETGENVPSEIKVEIEVSELSPDTRNKIVAWRGEYKDIARIGFDRTYTPNGEWGYGYVEVKIDSDTPTPAEIDQAILGAFAEIDQKRVEHDARQVELRKVERQEAERKASLEKELAKARELLKDDLGRLKELEAKHDLLSDFVYHIPDDACRGALKAMHQEQTEDSLDDLQERIENSSEHRIFSLE